MDGARHNAAEAGVDERVSFTVADVAAVTPDRPYGAVFAFECNHDMPDPVAVLAGMGRLAGEDGAVIVMDEAVGDEFTAPGSDAERLFYGCSLFCCLPDGMSHQPSAATGTVMRAGTLTDYATRAGFSRVEVLPIEHELFRFYRLHR